MPELPEVEIWRRALEGWMVGRQISAVHALSPTSIRATLGTRPVNPTEDLLERFRGSVGGRVEATDRHGKRLGLRIDDAWWLVHLGMTGRFEQGTMDPPPHARVGWSLDDGHTVWFRDARRFGAVVPLDRHEALGEGLGPDGLELLTGSQLAARYRGRRAVKVALLDQAALAGLGNIHAVEALWRAGLDPDTPVEEVEVAAWARLASQIPVQLSGAIQQVLDASDFTYVTEGGENPFAVYGREGQPCPRCGEAVLRAVHGGRSTFWCPRCQTR